MKNTFYKHRFAYFCSSLSQDNQYIWTYNFRLVPPGLLLGIATDYGLNDRGASFRAQKGLRIFSFPRCLDRLWGASNLVYTG
jgi:hypothetical protein